MELLNPALLACAVASLISACAYFFVRLVRASTERQVQLKLTDAAIDAAKEGKVDAARVLLAPVLAVDHADPEPSVVGAVAEVIEMRRPGSPSPPT